MHNNIILVSLISGSVLSFDATYDITAWKPSDVSTPQLFTFCTKTKADDYEVALEGLAFKLTLLVLRVMMILNVIKFQVVIFGVKYMEWKVMIKQRF